jgi:hypothetical protein
LAPEIPDLLSATVTGAAGLSTSAMVSRMYLAWVTMPISSRSELS